ncbi:DUF4238 domain-containing protein [Fluviicola taffensis]|uniref:DUF4238 domain-containing protein n=1 Tax=Fluviicola taffensis (strain DSM 16823 / NCIMB 13979 / RW262) TaxID=755732 RepID=F2I9W6_FLUTR|nr:DUF4238 domain-containing protein [Fluviicola taffensis]AEA44124.1 hypothetical protein Fluta_2138 [Fluviicola taffensis DSM 16823]
MAEKKKQHFVPQLLLRHFSTDRDKKLINIFNSDSKFYKSNCPLKSQGQESYFYGEDGIIENALGELESNAAPIVSNIISNKTIPKRDSLDSQNLFLFSMLLSFRTKNTVKHMNEVVDKPFQEIKKLDSRFNDNKYDNIHVGLKNPAAFSLSMISKEVLNAYDLGLKLIVNKSNKKFITSDHPAVLYNQFLEERKHPGGHLGIFTKGLQLFFPISPECMLVYYDTWAYKVGNKKDNIIYTQNSSDIDQLNFLQMVNCTEMIYTNDSVKEFELFRFSDKAKSLRTQDRTKFYEVNTRYKDDEGLEHIQYIQHGDNRNINLKLSFIKQPQGAKSHKLSDYVLQFRDERLRYRKRNASH